MALQQRLFLWAWALGSAAGVWALWPDHPFWAAGAALIGATALLEVTFGLGSVILVGVFMFAIMVVPMFFVMGTTGLGVAAVMALIVVSML